MKKILVVATVVILTFFASKLHIGVLTLIEHPPPPVQEQLREIAGFIEKGETLSAIFKRYKLDAGELHKIRQVSASIHKLRELHPGRPYKITLNGDEQIHSFVYGIDNDNLLSISRTETGYSAEKVVLDYDKKIIHVGGAIKDNLISSLGAGSDSLVLALGISDIFAWDIDFSTDLRKGDSFKVVVEGLYRDGEFKRYGKILSSEFINNGKAYHAYAFDQNGETAYYDDDGKSLKKAFLVAPLSFRRISSGYTNGRYHPILKIKRPHHAIDYAAAAGTPVSAASDGSVIFAGWNGGYGKLIIIRHPNGYKTYYGHLSRFGKHIQKGAKVQQGQVIGYVGSTGIATGPHLHYEMRINDKPVNPHSIKMPPGKAVPEQLMAEFNAFKDKMDVELASIKPSDPHVLTRTSKPAKPRT